MDLAAERLYHYVWHEVADKILEDSKSIFRNGKKRKKIQENKHYTQSFLHH